jgi:hypothetical protein
MHLAEHAAAVAIVSGFCVFDGQRATAETDGPPGALFLARALRALDVEVTLVSDCHGLPLLAAGCQTPGLAGVALLEFPFEPGGPTAAARLRDDDAHNEVSDRWVGDFLTSERGQRLTHLIAIERPGPSHTIESLVAQPRTDDGPLARFQADVAPADRNLCHNMRGLPVHAWTAKTHRLFEIARQRRPDITTIGVGDGGNELGMGRFAWEHIVAAVPSAAAGRIACRVATEFAIVAGVSNWGGYALGLAVSKLRGSAPATAPWTAGEERNLIEMLVRDAGAVDGLTLRREPTVDGLELDEYLRPLVEMQRILLRENIADG